MTRVRRLVGIIVGAIACGLALETPSDAGGSLGFTNGNFEQGGAGPFTSSTPGWGGWLGPADPGSNYGIAQSTVAPDVAESGSFYAFFKASQEIADCLGQGLNTVPGQKYAVSFWLATDGPTDGTTDLMQLSWGPDFGASGRDQLFNIQPHSPTALPYQQYTEIFTGVTTYDILAFHGFDKTSAFLLDNVTVTPLSAAPATPPLLSALLGASLLVLGVSLVRSRPSRRPLV